jgi:hypothetical protein
MARLAGAIPLHDCINMDASDAGVCGVWHSQKKFFALQHYNGTITRKSAFRGSRRGPTVSLVSITGKCWALTSR